ncbi:hypothetical protein [Streptomyces fructofermentans]|uniref:Uncharacterized protein n=1 Tax=Streptomyces fructofermentans TaxID=152141 RepID=A0A918N8A2_9ACTN|nr:hypothetical protein [Streptomyces fructofermentans]GGX47417.1 hypothetical protein GCM10010515_13110 [Streptomyces fructofermentans]
MATPPGQQPAQPYGQPPIIIINNSSSAAASSASVIGGSGLRRRRQSLWAHFWLFMFTAGIGNIFYAMHVNRWNRDRGL